MSVYLKIDFYADSLALCWTEVWDGEMHFYIYFTTEYWPRFDDTLVGYCIGTLSVIAPQLDSHAVKEITAKSKPVHVKYEHQYCLSTRDPVVVTM